MPVERTWRSERMRQDRLIQAEAFDLSWLQTPPRTVSPLGETGTSSSSHVTSAVAAVKEGDGVRRQGRTQGGGGTRVRAPQ